jgi:hypothetical protein
MACPCQLQAAATRDRDYARSKPAQQPLALDLHG